MTIASISGIKNESDVIESFVRHNAKFIDDFYFIDDSADKTPAILAKLAGEGFRIFTIKFDTRDYQHSKIMTNATRYINQERKYDWIFYLDADEILYYPTTEQFLQTLAANRHHQVGVLHHYEMAANQTPYFNSLNPLKECFNVRTIQSLTNKIFIRGDMFDKVMIGPGQHDVLALDGKRCDYFESGMQLAHFPVRSASQYVTRTIIIYTSLLAKLNKIPGEGNHAIRQYEWLKQNDFVASDAKVTEWGLQFGLDDNTRHQCQLTADRPVLLDDIVCKYHELARRNDTLLLGLELERVAGLLSDFRHKTHQSVEQLKSLF